MHKLISVTVIAASLTWSAFAWGQNTTVPPNASPPSSDAEKNAFTGKDHRQNSSGSTSGTGSGGSDSNPESRLSDHGAKNVQPDKGKK